MAGEARLSTVVIAYESEEAARRRLEAFGYAADVATEIAVYLAQSTDLPLFTGDIARALGADGLEATFVPLDELPARLRDLAPRREETIVWALTDGVRFYRGSAVPALARLEGFARFGSPATAAHLAPVRIGANVLAVDRLKKHYRVAASALFGSGEARTVRAVEDVSFAAREAEVLAIVGESGCGKSTLAKVLLGLEMASEGLVVLGDEAIQNRPVEHRAVDTIASIQMIFQNPFDTLNPSYTVGSQILRTLERFRIGASGGERRETMLKLLDLVKLPRAFALRSPRQLSGGQKQRIGVARAFAGKPRVIIADEPMSALDVSVQAAISELLMNLQRESKTTMVFISHDLSVVRYLADRVVVMYLGHIVEMGATEQIFSPPFHPYTEALLAAIPIADPTVKKRHVVLEGEIPSALSPPKGCPFQTRCGHKASVAGNLCEREAPPMRSVADGHTIKCHLPVEALERMQPVFS